MSVILSGLILKELREIDDNPALLLQQTQLASAIANAVATYLSTPGAVLLGTAPTAVPTPLVSVGGLVGPPLIIVAN
jgi:hypothetical protein